MFLFIRGESVAHFFINLPSKKLHGEYFRVIKQPISLNLIKKRIALGEYPTWAEFESAVHLIRTNAEEYNDEQSSIVEDVRKLDVSTQFHIWASKEADTFSAPLLGPIPQTSR